MRTSWARSSSTLCNNNLQNKTKKKPLTTKLVINFRSTWGHHIGKCTILLESKQSSWEISQNPASATSYYNLQGYYYTRMGKRSRQLLYVHHQKQVFNKEGIKQGIAEKSRANNTCVWCTKSVVYEVI